MTKRINTWIEANSAFLHHGTQILIFLGIVAHFYLSQSFASKRDIIELGKEISGIRDTVNKLDLIRMVDEQQSAQLSDHETRLRELERARR